MEQARLMQLHELIVHGGSTSQYRDGLSEALEEIRRLHIELEAAAAEPA